MRLFVFARHAESVPNVAHVLNSDPFQPGALTPRGRRQARKLGVQLANLGIDLAFCTRFPRTRETAELALGGRDVPLLVEPELDEVRAGVFDGAPRSEEHTSELQSHHDLVCRLLLEKKKKKKYHNINIHPKKYKKKNKQT